MTESKLVPPQPMKLAPIGFSWVYVTSEGQVARDVSLRMTLGDAYKDETLPVIEPSSVECDSLRGHWMMTVWWNQFFTAVTDLITMEGRGFSPGPLVLSKNDTYYCTIQPAPRVCELTDSICRTLIQRPDTTPEKAAKVAYWFELFSSTCACKFFALKTIDNDDV